MNDHQKLRELAIEASKNSHSPYSNARVGSALQTSSGQYFSGCNIENSSYSLTCCAERVALFRAVAEGFTKFKALSVSTKNAGMPCGACRQVIWDLCGDIPIHICDHNGLVNTNYTTELIPQPFDKTKL